MRLLRTTLLLALTGVLAACGARRIPGTDIKDTRDTRAVFAVIEQYRTASERRDPAAVLALVSKKYFDDAGTADPADDLDYGLLERRIADDFSKITALRLGIEVRQIEVEDDRAAAYVYYDEHYRIATRAGEVAKNASDPHRMGFVREAGAWKIVSGL